MQNVSGLTHTTPVTPPAQQAQNRDLIQAVQAINQTDLMGSGNELSFALDRESGRAVIRIVDTDTKEVIQQVPPEYVLRMAEDLALTVAKKSGMSR
jgi:flagellar protein FlaG